MTHRVPIWSTFFPDGQAVKAGEREADEQTDPAIEGEKGIPAGFPYALDLPGGGIRNAPVGRPGLAGPHLGKPLWRRGHKP